MSNYFSSIGLDLTAREWFISFERLGRNGYWRNYKQNGFYYFKWSVRESQSITVS